MKNVKKTLITCASVMGLSLLAGFGVACGDKGGDGGSYSLKVNPTSSVKITEEGFIVEHGEFVTIPNAIVVNEKGEMMDGYTVTRTIKNASGNKVASSFLSNNGDKYTVT